MMNAVIKQAFLIRLLLCFVHTESFAITQKSLLNKQRHSNWSLFGGANDLPTSYEWLAEEKDLDLDWLHPGSVLDNEYDGCIDDANIVQMSLYPLEACYIPLLQEGIDEREYAIIRNVEPQNIKMALDLKQKIDKEGSARFCAVLRANDTGRIATIGTSMRVVETEEQYLWDGKTIARIILKCIPEDTVEILNILNPKAWSRENRLLRSEEYLTANVVKFGDADLSSIVDNSAASEILLEYEAVKNIYETNDKVSSNFPPFALKAISSLPSMGQIVDNETFWSAAHIWQKLCFTVKEARRVNLQSIVHEKTISAAMKKGGPLNLPIHREDLPSDVRMELNELEREEANNFIAIGMEPCLDFQKLLATKKLNDRITLFSKMIAKERTRLEEEIRTDTP
mmetsp:Transcript_13536/g.20541  ORF Transcript_13536/g.20541 Transcript_13536/m.20541 type:complete len:397 (-) Transcript_13536:292-1482(-)